MPTLFNTTPDYRRLEDVLRGRKPDRMPLYEYFSDVNVQMGAIGNWPMNDTLPLGDREDLNGHIRGQYYLGYDYLALSVGFGFGGVGSHATTDSAGHTRNFLDEHNVPIACRKDLENYAWPAPEQVDYSGLDYASAHLPEGMRVVANLGGGLLEWGMWLMGAELFCLTTYDDPGLIRELLSRINEQQTAAARAAASHPDVFAVSLGDDMGFKTQTFLPPKALREFIFPGLKRVVDVVHEAGKPFILHSCGNLTLVMDDLIDYVGIDAKHSFEDVIMPVAEVKKRWGDRVALLGGVDVDRLCTLSEPELRDYVRGIVRACAPSGAFALGSGNSIANYVPPGNLRVMCDEAIAAAASL